VTRALIDVPRPLEVDAWFVGPPWPQPVAASGSDPSRASSAQGTTRFREQAVRECLDTIGVLREYRAPEPGETWLTPAASERRLLAQVNAIIALGPRAMEQVIEFAITPDVADPLRVFASVLVLGCTAGSNWIARIVEIFVRTASRDAAEASAAVEACGLSPNSELDGVLRVLSEHEHPRVRAGAIRAWAFRDTLPESHWQLAMRDGQSEVVVAALQTRLGTYDSASCDRALESWYGSDNHTVARFALRAGAMLGLRSARVAAIESLRRDSGWADAATSLAMMGYLSDSRLIRELLAGPGVRSGIVAAAVLGSTELVPDLLMLLGPDVTDDIRLSSARAVTTITGIPAIEGDQRAVASVWNDRASSFDPRVRYRAGEQLTPELFLRFLRASHLTRRDRQDAFAELSAVTESTVPRFSPYDFVGVQLQSLATIEHWLAQGRRDPAHRRNHG
jgi:hypothetical protein